MALIKNFPPFFSEGREYIEAPGWADFAVVVVMLISLYSVLMTIHKKFGWNPINGILMGGIAGLAFFYLFGVKFFKNMVNDFFFWCWVIHLWVEGTWELIAASFYEMLVIRIFGYPKKKAYKYLFMEAGLILFTGILGIGHHYYWIGTRSYWLLLGGFFSVLEALPLLLMVFDAMRIAYREKTVEHQNKPAKYLLIGGVIMHFLGAGVWGFIHTLPQVNKWTHGTLTTSAHGHIAFYGAYAMLVIAVIYYPLPRIHFGKDGFDGRKGLWSFLIITIGVAGMVPSLTGASVLQVFIERIGGLHLITVQDYMWYFYVLKFLFGIFIALEVIIFFIDVISQRKQKQ